MSEADRIKWDARYRDGAYAEREHPSPFVVEQAVGRPVEQAAGRAGEQAVGRPVEQAVGRAGDQAASRALDVACGAGRNSLFLAAAGWQVDAVDISAVGLERARRAAAARGLDIRLHEADLEANPAASALPAGPFGLIVLVRYVHRGLLPPLIERLAPGGRLLCEQHVDSSEDVVGPRTAAFRLRANELLEAVTRLERADLRVIHYSEGVVPDPDGRRAALARLVVEKHQAAPARPARL